MSDSERSETDTGDYIKLNAIKAKAEKEHKISDTKIELKNDEQHEKKHEPTLLSSLKSFFLGNWLNVLLVFVPIGIVLGAMKQTPTAVFIINFLAIIPLAKLLGTSTENIAARTSQSIGALLNASFGNAVELIVSIFALTKGLIRVVQGSLIGSVLSNLLLVLGMCFVAGGAKYKTQTFNKQAAQTSCGILLMAVFGALMPAALRAQLSDISSTGTANSTSDNGTSAEGLLHPDPQMNDKLLILSRGTAIILLIVYFLFLYFQLFTHKFLYEDGGDEDEEAELTLPFAIVALVLVTVLVAVCAEYLVDSIEDIVTLWGISESFVGLIVLPIVGNAAEHLTAVTVAYKNKMDLAIGVAIGSSQQIALMVMPLLVLLGWIIGVPMSLYFETFETAVLFICVIVVNSLISDGESNWLEGVMLLAVYVICAVAFYVI